MQGPIELDLRAPVIMGILNLSPDSFSDGGQLRHPIDALRHAERLVAAGAQILDIGGESTRPGASPVDAHVERARILPTLDALAAAGLPALLSVDTSKADVALAALEHGAHLINDVTALRDPRMAQVVASCQATVILMHMQGEPRTMQHHPAYHHVVEDVKEALHKALNHAIAHGIDRRRIWLDPGIGFGKTAQHNLLLTRHLGCLQDLGRPIVYGPSRKAFLGAITGQPPLRRDAATAAACVAAVLAGAQVLRVHNVQAVRDSLQVAHAIRQAQL